MEISWSACAILALVFLRKSATNFSSHFFPQKPTGPEWGSRFPAASLRTMAVRSREKIVTMGAPVLRFACRKHMTTNRKWRSSVCGEQAKPQKDNQKSELEFKTSTCPLAHE